MKTVLAVLLAALVAGAACGGEPQNPVFATNAITGQRTCPPVVSCDDLVKFTCGHTDACGGSKSCKAARKLQAEGNDTVCETAWCHLGESYRACAW